MSLNVKLGEVSYDIRIARAKAKEDIAAIEADANASVQRIKAKYNSISFGSGGMGGGGYGGGGHGGGGSGGEDMYNGGSQQMPSSQQGAYDNYLAPTPKAPKPPKPPRGSRGSGGGAGDEDTSWLKPAGLRTLKYTTIGLIAYTVTSFMGAIEQTLNESLSAGNDVIKQEMVNRNFKRNMAGSIPLIGGMLTNVMNFAGMGEADRESQRQIAFREMRGGMSVFGAGTTSLNLGVAGATSRSGSLASLFGSRSSFESESAALREEMRKTIQGMPEEKGPRGFDNPTGTYKPGEGPQAEDVKKAFYTRLTALENKRDEEMDFARTTLQMDLKNQQAANKGLNLEAQLRPTQGFATSLSESSRSTFRTTIDANNKKRISDVDLNFNKRRLSDEEEQQNKDIDKANELAGEQLKGSIAKAEVAKKDVLMNIFGGRPTEITGMQSVEAMRDISPENNQVKLDSLQKAIDEMTQELRFLNHR